MNISYRIELSCTVKDKYSELTFVNLVDLTKLVNTKIASARQVGVEINDKFLSTETIAYNDNLILINEITPIISNVLTKSEACRNCDLSMGGKFGCYQNISLPLTENAAQYLLNKTMIAWESPISKMFIKFILDKKMNGERNKLNLGLSHPDQFYKVILQDGYSSHPVDVFQIFDALFPYGTIDRIHALYSLLFSGQVVLKDKKEGKLCFYEKSLDKWVIYKLDVKYEDASIKDLNHYFYSLFLSLFKDLRITQYFHK